MKVVTRNLLLAVVVMSCAFWASASTYPSMSPSPSTQENYSAVDSLNRTPEPTKSPSPAVDNDCEKITIEYTCYLVGDADNRNGFPNETISVTVTDESGRIVGGDSLTTDENGRFKVKVTACKGESTSVTVRIQRTDADGGIDVVHDPDRVSLSLPEGRAITID